MPQAITKQQWPSSLTHISQVSKVGTSNYIPHILWDVITCPCPWCLFLTQPSSVDGMHAWPTRFPSSFFLITFMHWCHSITIVREENIDRHIMVTFLIFKWIKGVYCKSASYVVVVIINNNNSKNNNKTILLASSPPLLALWLLPLLPLWLSIAL